MGAPRTEPYSASIVLDITVPAGHDYDLELLKLQVRVIQENKPWIARPSDTTSATSLNQKAKVSAYEEQGSDRHYNVDIQPPASLSLDQIDAYERHGNELAKMMASIVDKDVVLRVTSRIALSSKASIDGYRPRDL